MEGWLSPGRAQGFNTPDLLAKNGVTYGLDWANDDLPYEMRTKNGPLIAMPMAYETDDRVVADEYFQSEADWVQQVKDRFDVLYRESADYGGRIMSLPIHSWFPACRTASNICAKCLITFSHTKAFGTRRRAKFVPHFVRLARRPDCQGRGRQGPAIGYDIEPKDLNHGAYKCTTNNAGQNLG